MEMEANFEYLMPVVGTMLPKHAEAMYVKEKVVASIFQQNKTELFLPGSWTKEGADAQHNKFKQLGDFVNNCQLDWLLFIFEN